MARKATTDTTDTTEADVPADVENVEDLADADADAPDAEDVETEETEEETEETEAALELPDGPSIDPGNLAEQYELGKVEDQSDIADSELFARAANDYVANLVGARNTATQEDGFTLRAAHDRALLRMGITLPGGMPDFAGTSQTYVKTVQAIEAAIWAVPNGASDAQKKEHNQRKARVNGAIRKQYERVVLESAVLQFWSGTGYFGDVDGDWFPANAASETLKPGNETAERKWKGLKWTTRRVAADGFTTHPSVLADPPEWAKREIRAILAATGTTQAALLKKYGMAVGTGGGPDADGDTSADAPAPDAIASGIAEEIGKGTYGDEGAATMALRILSALSLKHATGSVDDRERVAAIWTRMAAICTLTEKGITSPLAGHAFTEEDALALDALRWKVATDGAVK